MKDLTRRELMMAVSAGAAAFAITPTDIVRATASARRRTTQDPAAPRFFTPHEWQTVRLLVDIVIPRDQRSGSATDAGVPEFMDFIMLDGDESRRTAMRGGLAWLDTECRERFGRNFVDGSVEERRAILDDIAWPESARADLTHGVRFFNAFRNLTAGGFWSSKMGIADLQYMGNTGVAEWRGCSDEQLRKLGLR